MKRTFADIMEDELRENRGRLLKKVPEWSGHDVELPVRLSIEQCSSSVTALYKAGLAASMHPGARILDLTGGLGVDSWAFSRKASSVTYVERNPELAALAERNFSRLGLTNVTAICGDCRDNIKDADIIYLDPARRSGTGRKVFKLEECEPDILTLLPQLREHAPTIIVKLSPMADLTEISRLLKPQEIHVVSVSGEVKEVIAIIRDGFDGEAEIVASNGTESLRFTRTEEAGAVPEFPEHPDDLVGKYLFEPDPALLKAGCFNLICSRSGLQKLGRSTHLYISGTIQPFGKCRPVREVEPFGNKSIREMGKRYPDACVTARNIPITSDGLARKMGVSSSGGTHIFGVTIDSAVRPGRYLVVTEK